MAGEHSCGLTFDSFNDVLIGVRGKRTREAQNSQSEG